MQTLINDALMRYTELDSRWDLALTVGNAAALAAALGQFERAALLAAASKAERERLSVSVPDTFQRRFAKIEKAAEYGLDEEEFAAA